MVDLNITLPEHFLDEEERCGFVVTRQRKEIWAVELDLLAEFSRVCDKHRIRWFLDGGSILGAVRHKGFIPWDDDIDISMPRCEYEKLCKVAASEFKHPYFFQTYDSDPGYHRMHAQFRNSDTTGILKGEWPRYSFNQGIFIDIFPFDNVPDRDKERKDFGKSMIKSHDRIHGFLTLTRDYKMISGWSLKHKVTNCVLHLLVTLLYDRHGKLKTMLTAVTKMATKYNCVATKSFANLSLPYQTFSHKNYFSKEWYTQCEMVSFEMLTVPVPAGYIEYLHTLYGNWETPMMSKSQHGDIFFDVSRPYTFYLRLDNNCL